MPRANRKNSPREITPTATNQGAVTAANSGTPHRQCSRPQAAVGPPHHHEATPEQATSASPTGPLVRVASPARTQNVAASRFEGFCDSSQRQNWTPTSQRVSVASVVASFDSMTMIGDVVSINAAKKPARGPITRLPIARTSKLVAVPASAETSRAPNGLSPPRANPPRISQ